MPLDSPEMKANESSISPLARPHLSSLAGFVTAARPTSGGQSTSLYERASSHSHKLVLERGLRKGREGQGLFYGLGSDEAEVIDPHPSAGLQHAVEFAQGLREFRPVMHADSRHHHVKGLVGVGKVRHIGAFELHTLLQVFAPGVHASPIMSSERSMP